MENDLIKLVKGDKFASFIGLELMEVREGYARVQMVVTDNHLNGVGRVQGGAIFTLADYAFAAACNSRGDMTLGFHVDISYILSPKGRVLTAEAREVSTQKRLCVYNVDVLDEDGTLVARANCTGYIKR